MYRVMIADDEPWAIYGLQKLIDWETLGFQIVETAMDGLSALQLASALKPDLILSDIHMPGIDGLTLVHELKTASPNSTVILITGHSDFAYAQEALRQGVFDYLVKQVKKTELEAALLRVKQHLDKKGTTPSWELYFEFFGEDNQRSIHECLQAMSVNAPQPYCRFITFLYGQKPDIPILSIEHNNTMPLIRFRTGTTKEACLILIDDVNSDPVRLAYAIAMPGCKQIGISTLSDASDSFLSLYQQSDIAAMTGSLRSAKTPLIYTVQTLDALDESLHAFTMALRTNHKAEMLSVLDDLIRKSRHLFFDMIVALGNRIIFKLKEYKFGAYGELELQSYQQFIGTQRPLEEVFASIRQCIQSNFNGNVVSKSQVHQIMDIIDESYTQDLHIADLEKRFFLTANYLSILIKKETGYTFTDLIIHKRIELARKLLIETSLPIQDIVERVGYRDYSSFIKLFKKHLGCTPHLYRKESN